MSFRLLDAAVPAERAAWLDAWRASPDREPFAHPSYVALFAKPGEGALCAVHASGDGGVLYPLLRRPLAALPWCADDEAAVDLASPYGYGGPFTWGTVDAPGFWHAFEAWAKDARAVTSFTRHSLFDDQTLAPPEPPQSLFTNVVRSLDLDADALWMDYAHKVRKNVNKARKAGLTVEVDAAGARLQDFLQIYQSTMDRREARDDFYFPESFFRTIVEDLRESFVFFHVLHEGRVVSTELVLVGARHLYSYLGGTLADAFDLRPNDLLKHEVIEWGRAQGKRAFVLGGGYGADDGITRYKLSFAPEGSVPFKVSKRVHDAAAVARLCERRKSQEPTWEPKDAFFPAYRS